jgi:hypothetical protein
MQMQKGYNCHVCLLLIYVIIDMQEYQVISNIMVKYLDNE